LKAGWASKAEPAPSQSLSLREIQEQELRRQQELKNREMEILRQQQLQSKSQSPRWGAWGSATGTQKVNLKEIQEQELKSKPVDQAKPVPATVEEPLPLNWVKQPEPTPVETKQLEKAKSKKSKQAEEEEKKAAEAQAQAQQQAKKNQPKKVEPEPKKQPESDKNKKTKQPEPQPKAAKKEPSAWGSVPAATSQPKSLREIQESELQTAVASQPRTQTPIANEDDFFWGTADKPTHPSPSKQTVSSKQPASVLKTEEFPSLSGTKKKAVERKLIQLSKSHTLSSQAIKC
jgi:hypothetical protein